MTSRLYYAALVGLFALGAIGVSLFPDQTILILAVLVVAAIAGAVISTIYMYRIYRKQPLPRSRFFGMALESFAWKIGLGLWVGYLTVARILDRADKDNPGSVPFLLPAPDVRVSGPITGLIIVLVFAAPIRFAIEVFRVRVRSHSADVLDRRDDE